jgi:hypothetical protein
VSEVRYRRDGGSDRIASVDAFKITRHEIVLPKSQRGQAEWHITGLYPWSRAMLAAYFDAAFLRGDNPGVLRDAMGGHVYTADELQYARWFCEAAAEEATKPA